MRNYKHIISLVGLFVFSIMLCLPSIAQVKQEPVKNPATELEEIKANSEFDAIFYKFYEKWRGTNKIAPDFTAYDLANKPVKLSDFRGKVVIVDFWYTACHNCIEAFPMVHRIAEKYANQGVVVITACMPEKRENYESFVKKNQAKYPRFIWLHDRSAEKMQDGVAMKEYGLIGAPSQMIIDRQGRVVDGVVFDDDLFAALVRADVKVDKADIDNAIKERIDIEKEWKKNRS